MAHRKPAFCFRIPWLPGAHESSSRRPKDTSKSTTQSDTNVPIQRPSAINSADSSPKRAEPQNKSPAQLTSSSVIIETTQSKPPSPSTSPNLVNSTPSSHASQVHVELIQPQSPSHNDTMKAPKSSSAEEKEKMANKFEPVPQETNPELKATSLLRETIKPPETASSMLSLSPVSKTEPASQLHPPSPLALKQTNEVLKANHEETTLNASSTSQEEKEKMAEKVPNPMQQEAEPKKSPLKIITKSPKTSSQPTKANSDVERSISRKQKASLESQSKFLQHEEKEKVTKKVGKAKDTSTTSHSTRGTNASTSGTKDKKQHGVKKTVERKIMFATSNSSGKDIGVMNSADPRTKYVSSSSISPQRTIPSNEESEKEKTPMQKGIKDDITKFVHKISASVNPTQPMEDKQFSVITLAGDNRGATMHVGSESVNKEGSIHIHRAYKTDSEESTEVTTDGEGNTNAKEDEDSMEHGEVGKAYVNSNIQSINNSLMFHGSINERDPGVQVTIPKKPLEVNKPYDIDTQNHRTEFNLSRVQKSTYQPIVRRRCLRGLLHEPNDSDDPNKPRSHGCKFSCGKNNEDIEIL